MERKGRGRSFHVDGPKTEKAWEPKVESGVKHLEIESYQKQSGEYGRVCKVEDSHRYDGAVPMVQL